MLWVTTSRGLELQSGHAGRGGREDSVSPSLGRVLSSVSLENSVCPLFAHGNHEFSFSHSSIAGRLGCGHE